MVFMANSSESSAPSHSATNQTVDNQVSGSSKSSDPQSSRLRFGDSRNNGGPLEWIQTQIENGVDPKDVLNQLIPSVTVPDDVTDVYLWKIVWEILSEPAPRSKLENVNSIQDVKDLITTCKNIVVLTGAGVSVSCGIPDFRSRDGVYARLSRDYPDLPDPQAMFDITYFRSNPWPFFKFAKEIFPGQFTPSLSHRFISYLDKQNKLLRNYTQNIDTLEQVAGIKNVVQCHGSFARATCMNCKHSVDSELIKEDIFDQKIPFCTSCQPAEGVSNIMKPDIVFFGENLPQDFYQQIEEDKDKVDLLIVIGSSLKVRPVSLIPSLIPESVPQVLINRESLPHVQFDVELLGNCDDVICELCDQMEGDWLAVNSDFKKSSLHPDVIEAINHLNRELSVDEDYLPPQERKVAGKQIPVEEKDVDDDLNVKKSFDASKEQCNHEDNKTENGQNAAVKESNDHSETAVKDDNLDPVKEIDDVSNKSDNSKYVKNNFSKETSKSQEGSLIKGQDQHDFERKRKRTNSFNNLDVNSILHSQTKKKRTFSAGSDIVHGETLYYMRIPPNRYIFSGAELALDCESSDSEGEGYGEEESSGEEEELSDEEGLGISNESVNLPKDGIKEASNITESKFVSSADAVGIDAAQIECVDENKVSDEKT